VPTTQPPHRGPRLLLRNEFATVEVSLDETANGPRLLIRDLETGRQACLDALEVESLTRMSHDDFVDRVRPV
jgi:hypothetical protein